MTTRFSVFSIHSCSSFKVLSLMLRSLIHCWLAQSEELLLVQGERQGPSFSLLHADTRFC
jgi:hypothetical protein